MQPEPRAARMACCNANRSAILWPNLESPREIAKGQAPFVLSAPAWLFRQTSHPYEQSRMAEAISEHRTRSFLARSFSRGRGCVAQTG